MQAYKSRFLDLCLRIVLMGGMAMGMVWAMGSMGAMSDTAFAAACVLGTPCSAGGVGITITGGLLTATTNTPVINNGLGVVATGIDQTIPFKFLTQVTDGRGTGVGWHMTTSATTLTFGAGGPTSDLFLDASAPVTVTCAADATCVSGTLVLGTAGTDLVTAPVTLVSAPVNGGRGSFNISTLGSFVVPASAGNVTATGGAISVTVDTAP